MALSNLFRVPARTVLGGSGLVIGVAALTVLVAVNRAFQGVLVGTLLGQALSVQVRGVDFLSAVMAMVLGGLSVADVVFLSLRERAAELVTLRTTGWESRHVRWLTVAEGLAIGALGSLTGATLGVALVSLVTGIAVASMVLAGAIGAMAGIGISALATLLPVLSIDRLTPPAVLADE
jgi:ABC-type antimicrobial peptide transport system permease subunit